LYKSVLDDDHHSRKKEMNHIIYAEKHGINHSLSYGILTFLNVVRCRKEIGRFYRENEHFRELLSVMKHKYGSQTEFSSRDPSIINALNQVVNVMFDRHQRKKRKQCNQLSTNDYLHNQVQDNENRHDRKCSNSLCQMIENNVSKFSNFSEIYFKYNFIFLKQIKFEDCPNCHQLSYCSQYCREVHWTLNHNLSCQSVKDNKTALISYHSAFETLPVQISQPIIEATTEITNDLCYPSSSSSSSSSTGKKKSFKTLLSLLRVNGKRC
jgi:hypothetical protein